MASLSAFHRITKFQKVLLLSNIHTFSHSTTGNAPRATLVAFFHSSNRCTVVHTIQQPSSSHQLTQLSFPRCTAQYKRNYATEQQQSSSKLDEFRAREEKREEELYKKESESQSNEKTQEDADKAKMEAIRNKILECALKYVPIDGWSQKTLIQGAEDAGYPAEVHGIFAGGSYDLVSYFVGKCNDSLLEYLQAESKNGPNPDDDHLDFLCRAVKFRLKMIEPYIDQWPQALALISLPQNVPTSLARVLTMVDDICYYSGDRSVDFGWYTRRVGLATIYKMTEVYMIQDKSVDRNDTWTFLRNRMEEAIQLQAVLSQTGDLTKNFQRSFNSAFITARNLLGMNYDRR